MRRKLETREKFNASATLLRLQAGDDEGSASGTSFDDPISSLFALAAARGLMKLLVLSPCGSLYQLDRHAIEQPRDGFLMPASLATGRFIVARGLMLDGSLEVQLDGRPLLACESEVCRALKLGRTSGARLRAIVRTVLQQLGTDGLAATKELITESVREFDDVWDVSSQAVWAAAVDIDPTLSLPGRRRKVPAKS